MSAPPIINGKEVFDLLRDDLVALEDEFGRDTVSGVEAITEIGEYLRGGGGKRIRPALLLLSAKLFDYQGRGAVRLGAVVEIIHTATLVHDDIIDALRIQGVAVLDGCERLGGKIERGDLVQGAVLLSTAAGRADVVGDESVGHAFPSLFLLLTAGEGNFTDRV